MCIVKIKKTNLSVQSPVYQKFKAVKNFNNTEELKRFGRALLLRKRGGLKLYIMMRPPLKTIRVREDYLQSLLTLY